MEKKTKRESPTETLEDEDTEFEQLHMKFPREELDNIGLFPEKDYVGINKFRREYLLKERKKPYSIVHTHPYNPDKNSEETFDSFFPSPNDIKNFVNYPRLKSGACD